MDFYVVIRCEPRKMNSQYHVVWNVGMGRYYPEGKNHVCLKDLGSCVLRKLCAGVGKACIASEDKGLVFVFFNYLVFHSKWFHFQNCPQNKIKLSSLNKCKQHASLLLNQFIMNPLLIIYCVFYNLWFYSPHSMIHSSNEWLSAPWSRSMWLGS